MISWTKKRVANPHGLVGRLDPRAAKAAVAAKVVAGPGRPPRRNDRPPKNPSWYRFFVLSPATVFLMKVALLHTHTQKQQTPVQFLIIAAERRNARARRRILEFILLLSLFALFVCEYRYNDERCSNFQAKRRRHAETMCNRSDHPVCRFLSPLVIGYFFPTPA